MAFKFVRYLAHGAQYEGATVCQLKDYKTGAMQVRVKKGQCVVARKTFDSNAQYVAFYLNTVQNDDSIADKARKLIEVIIDG